MKSSEEVEKKFGTPVIGMIPRSSSMRQGDGRELALAVTGSLSASNASTAEGFRKLRTNLAYMDVDHPPRVIVVTSPKQSDGKSTVAANLAAAIAIGGQTVTLIDGDLRRPTVADSLAIVDGAGLTDVLVGRVTPDDVIQNHPDVPGLRVLASGAIPPNPSELLGSKAMQTLVSDLARDAMVIIDAPPLLPVTDAAVLTRSADGAIVVVSHNGTLDTELAAALANIAAVHGRTLGIVFNRIRRSASSGFYGDYYRYEYKPDNGRRKLKGRAAGEERRQGRQQEQQGQQEPQPQRHPDRHALTGRPARPLLSGVRRRAPAPPWASSGDAAPGHRSATARSTSCALDSTGTPLLIVRTSSMPTRRCPPLDRLARMTLSVERPMPVADQLVVSAGRSRTAATSASVVPFMPPGTPITRSTWTLLAGRETVLVEQPAHRVHLPEVEQLELRDHAALLRELVELADERPGVGEDVVAEVRRPHGQAARVGLGVEDLEPLVERVVNAAAGGQLDDEVGGLADGRHPLAQQGEVEGRPVLGSRTWMWIIAAPARLAVDRGLGELLGRGRQVRAVFLGRLGAGRGHGDQQRLGHGAHRVTHRRRRVARPRRARVPPCVPSSNASRPPR